MLCGQHIRLDYDKQKWTITCQLKPIISMLRLQLQVNTWHRVLFWSVSEDGTPFWQSLFQTDIQWNCNFSTAIFSAIVIPTLFALKHLIAVSSRWPTGPLVNTYSMKQPNLYCSEAIKMTSHAWSNFVWRIRAAGEYSLWTLTRLVTSFYGFKIA